MRLAHPDNVLKNQDTFRYSAQEINEAYTFLNNLSVKEEKRAKKEKTLSKNFWSSPINENAFSKRNIYDEVIDHEGNSLGTILIARDKYIWIEDEEFRLFLKSIFDLSKELLDEIDERIDQNPKDDFISYQARIAYLLAGQFIDSKKLLFDLNLDIQNEDDYDIFYVTAMLEREGNSILSDGVVYPLEVKNHRLYICTREKEKLGYLSFSDDRLSFALTPLFEQKSVKIKMEMVSSSEKYKPSKISLWLKINKEEDSTYIDSVNLRINNLLRDYERRF